MEMLIFSILFLGAYGILFEPMSDKTGIIYTELSTTYTYYTKWHLCYYYDLGAYYEQINKLELCVKQMADVCTHINDTAICKLTTAMFSTDLGQIRLNNEAMLKMHRREKRAPLEFIGKLSNMAFGIMDAETARLYDDKVNELQSEAEINRKMARERTTLLKGFIELNNKTFNSFKENIDTLGTDIQKLQDRLGRNVAEVVIGQKFKDISGVATLIMIDHNELSNRIKKALEDSLSGGITDLIPITDLEGNFEQIPVEEGQILPTQLKGNGIYNLKNFITSKATLFNHKIFLEIGIPVLEKNKLTLFKAIPIPTNINNQLFVISPKSKYFLINFKDITYIPLTEDELRACLHFNDDTLICNPLSPVYHNTNGVCELAMFTNKPSESIGKTCKFSQVPKSNYIIQINMQDKYFMSPESPIDIVNSCGDGRVEMSKITENGVLTVEPGCIITTDDIQIRSHEHKYFNDTKIIIPKNDLQGLDLAKFEIKNFSELTDQSTVLIQNYEQEFRDLANQADELLEREAADVKFSRIHYDNVTHSYAILILIIIIIALAAVTAFIIYTKVNPLSHLLSLITGIPPTNEATEENKRNIVINIEGKHDLTNEENISPENDR